MFWKLCEPTWKIKNLLVHGQQNHFHGAPVDNKTTLAKKPRGSYDFATNGKNLVVSWLNNKVVTCTTNCVTCNPVSTTQRWSKSAKKQVDVPILKPFEDYSKQMGSVDLFNQFVSTYKACIRSKKWWWPFFVWAVNTSIANTCRSIYLCQKCNVALHLDCFKDYHSWCTKLIVLFCARSANNVNPATFFRKI